MSSVQNIKQERERFVLIEGKLNRLPDNAKYVFQDKRGVWFYSTRKPRVKNGDWTPRKFPIQEQTKEGVLLPKAIVTPPLKDWENTVRLTMLGAANVEREIERAKVKAVY